MKKLFLFLIMSIMVFSLNAQDEWNYLTIDGFDSKEDAMKSWSIPKKVSEASNKKYGTNSSMRVIRKRMASTLIMHLN